MPTTRSHRGGERQNFDVTTPDTLNELRVDGIVDVQIGVPDCKVTFFQTRPRDGDVEQREAVLVVSIGLHVLVESFTNVLRAISQNREPITDNVSKYADAVKEALSAMPALQPLTDTELVGEGTASKPKKAVRRRH